MKICQKCKKSFPFLLKIDGKIRNLGGRRFCVDCSPFGEHNTTKLINPAPKSTIYKLTKDEFKNLVENSNSASDIFNKLKLRKSGSSFSIFKKRISEDKINTSHFLNGGSLGIRRRLEFDEIFIKNSTYTHIRRRVKSDNLLEYKCSSCEQLPIWLGKKLTLELDHINGDRYDNRIENLRWLCPNCHSQTETFGKKTRKLQLADKLSNI